MKKRVILPLLLTFSVISAAPMESDGEIEQYDITISSSEHIQQLKNHIIDRIDAPIDFITVAEVTKSDESAIYYVDVVYKLTNDEGIEELWHGRGQFDADGSFIDLVNEGPYQRADVSGD